MKIQSIKTLGLLVVILMAIPFSISAQQGWENYKPSELFTKALKELMDSHAYVPKDTFYVITTATTVDSSDIGTITLGTFPQFKKMRRVWSAVIKSTQPFTLPLSYQNANIKKKEVFPFVGVEEWVFGNDEDAKACIKMLTTPGSFGSYRLDLRRPPREFALQGNRIYYFYTFPTDFYPNLVAVMDVFLKHMDKPVIAK